MKQFTQKTFTIPALIGISAKTTEEHLKLYAGYVKHANLILDKVVEYKKDTENNAYALGEIMRRFGFAELPGDRTQPLGYARIVQPWPAPVADANGIRKALIALAHAARAGLDAGRTV